MSDWRFDIDAEQIAWLYFDKQDSNVNILTSDALKNLERILQEIQQREPTGLVLLSKKKSGFAAGADVKEFSTLHDEGHARAIIKRAHDIMQVLEDFPCPSVTLIDGFCLGGGLELALTCNYRVCSDSPEVRIGFPETRLGIFPAFGGTVRSPALIGHLNMLELMLTNKNLVGKQAKAIGLVDEVVPTRQLNSAARYYLSHQPKRKLPPLIQRLAGKPLFRPSVASMLKRQVAKKARHDHYPAPYVLINHWRDHASSRAAMTASEQKNAAKLIVGETSQNLIRVFQLQMTLKRIEGDPDFKAHKVHVVGGGLMGGDIAAWCALRGLHVTLQDRSPQALSRAIGRANKLFKKRRRNPYLVRAAMDRLTADFNGFGATQADVVIEAIYENIEAKQNLYRNLELHMRPDALLATNTSSIPLETLGTVLSEPGRLVGLHFFNPVAKMPLVEIVNGPATDARMRKRAISFTQAIGKLPLPVKSSPGFLVNRVLMPYLVESMIMAEEGLPLATIDRAALDFGMPMGPIELADTVGLDTCLSVAEKLSAAFGFRVPQHLKKMVDSGQLGRKSGTGFYHYRDGKKQERAANKPAPQELSERLLAPLIKEAQTCLDEEIVETTDQVDAGVIFGTGFAPFRGGPLHYKQA